MNVVDIIVLGFVAAAAVNGLRLGAAALGCAYTGFAAGLALGWLLGIWLSPWISLHVAAPGMKLLIGMLILFTPAVAAGSAAHLVGLKARAALARRHLGGVDMGAGIVLAVFATLALAWLLGTVLANSPSVELDSQVQHSAILRALDRTMPAIDLSTIRRLVAAGGFSAFSQFAPLPPGSVTEASRAQVDEAASADQASVVKVHGTGCGVTQEGTGFVVSQGVVVTNAHVVAGIDNPVVDAPGQGFALPAEAILFDPEFDLAVLRVPGLDAKPLQVMNGVVQPATKVVALGYPENGPYDAQPGGILQEFSATGPDIYDEANTTRDVYQIQAVIRPGNSGGPLVEPDGEVVGVVFSRSTTDVNVGYALTSPGVITRVDQALANPQPVGPTACTG